MNGQIHSIQSLGTLDGPGVRCVVFLQGCPLRCIYCHNPDTWNPSGGVNMTPQEVFEKIKRYRSYYGSEGGVTVSGGEPLMQSAFVTELFTLCRQSGIHTAIDTSGHGADLKGLDSLLAVTDLVLLDVKMTTEDAYRQNIGGSLSQTLQMLNLLEEKNIPVWIRHVVVPGITDDPKQLARLGAFLATLTNIQALDVLPYHIMGVSKYKELDIPYPLEGIPAATQKQAKDAKQIILTAFWKVRRNKSE